MIIQYIHHAISGLLARACMDSDEKLFVLHNAMVPTAYAQQLNSSFCEFVTEACTWPCTSYNVGL